MDDVLTLTTMRFHDEVSSPQDLDGEVFEEAKPKKPEKRELEMAKQLIDSLTSDFDPDKYRDEYREELLDLLERKAAGKEVVSAPTEEPEPTKAPDLMAALEESLAAVKGEEAAADGKAIEGKAEEQGQGEVEELLQQRPPQEQYLSQEGQGLAAEVAREGRLLRARCLRGTGRPLDHGDPAEALPVGDQRSGILAALDQADLVPGQARQRVRGGDRERRLLLDGLQAGDRLGIALAGPLAGAGGLRLVTCAPGGGLMSKTDVETAP